MTTYLHSDCERLLFRLNETVHERDHARELLRIAEQRIKALEVRVAALRERAP